MNTRYYAALGCYGGLALLAWVTLEGAPRGAVWLFLAALAVKTWLRRGE